MTRLYSQILLDKEMYKMKKKLTLLLASLMMVVLVGCKSNVSENETQETADAAQTGTTDTTGTSDTTSNTGETLVVYYSAQDHTRTAANYIAESIGADTFELIPVEPYTQEDLNWNNDDSRVSIEHDNEDQRDVELTSTTVENWDSYDTIFIGYPIWWGIAAWPVDDFVKSNDFNGKTVIPFCTSASSGIARSGDLLEELAGTGDWKEGQRFGQNDSKKDVEDWISGLPY